MRIGYARVSTEDQKLDLQLDALQQAGCEKIFSDKISGVSDIRAGLTSALSHLRPGDTLVVWKLDRLGRSVRQLVDFVHGLEQRDVAFASITDGIDSSTPTGRFTDPVLAVGYPLWGLGERLNIRPGEVSLLTVRSAVLLIEVTQQLTQGMSGGPVLNAEGEVVGIIHKGGPEEGRQLAIRLSELEASLKGAMK